MRRLIPHRYVQWAVTTPLMVLILSKLSDFRWQRTAIVMGADCAMVLMGLASHFLPNPYHCKLPLTDRCRNAA
jgi:bacteriorhodopsin